MKRLAAILVVAAGCASAPPPKGTTEAQNEETKLEMGIASQIAFDLTKLKRGEYAIYSVRLVGRPLPDYVKYAVVDEDATSVWVENTVPADPRPFVLKSRFDRSDLTKPKLLEQWGGEAGSAMPAKIFPREGRKDEPPPRREASQTLPDFKEEPDQITVAGKTWMATKVTTTLTYKDGRKSTITDWYHKDVPFSVVVNRKSVGGLIKRQFGRLTMELAAWDTQGARPELDIPRDK